MKSVDEMIAEAQAYRAREYARLHQERKAAGLATIRLVQAPGEPELFSTQYQTEFQALRDALSDEDIEAEAPFMVMDSVGGGGGYIGELVIPFAQITASVVLVAIGAWLQRKSGRKARVKIGDNEIEVITKEAFTKEELEKLLQRLIDVAGFARAGKVERTEEWISGAEAVRLLMPVFNNSAMRAQETICKRAHNGLVRSRAERFIEGEKESRDFEIPKGFWWAEGDSALHQNWPIGDFDTWVERGNLHLRAFSVSFLRADIEKMIPATVAEPPNPSRGSPSAGGRPPADWWEDLLIDLCFKHFHGDLPHKKQADIVRAMQDWITAHGYDASESTIKLRARKLADAIKRDDAAGN